MHVAELPFPVPQPRLFDPSTRRGPFVDAVSHRVLQIGQRVLAAAVEVDSDEDGSTQAGGARRDPAAPAARRASTGKGPSSKAGTVSLLDILEAGLIAPGRDNLTINYKGVTYAASLLGDGTIEYEGQVFQTASALGIHCKRLITPNKQGDDGWKSVQYKEKPLDFFRKQLQERLYGGTGPTAAAAPSSAAAVVDGKHSNSAKGQTHTAAAGADAEADGLAALEEAALAAGEDAQAAPPRLGRRALAKAAAQRAAQQQHQADGAAAEAAEAPSEPPPRAQPKAATAGSGRRRRSEPPPQVPAVAVAAADSGRRRSSGRQLAAAEEAAEAEAADKEGVASPGAEEGKGRKGGTPAAKRKAGRVQPAPSPQAVTQPLDAPRESPSVEAAQPMEVDGGEKVGKAAAAALGAGGAAQDTQSGGVKISARIAARMQHQHAQEPPLAQGSTPHSARASGDAGKAAAAAPVAGAASGGRKKGKAGLSPAVAAPAVASAGKAKTQQQQQQQQPVVGPAPSAGLRGKRNKKTRQGSAPGAEAPLMIDGQLVVELAEGTQGLQPSDQWVQCDRCATWRLVPNKWWQAVQEDEREEWLCEYAQWDVRKVVPNKPPCKAR